MDKMSIAQLEANIRVKDVFDRYPEEVAKNASFSTNVVVFDALIVEVTELERAIGNIPSITASSKADARSGLETVCMRMSKQMHVFADTTKNFELADFLKLNISAYNRLRTVDMSIYAQALLDNANLYADDLSTVGIEEAQITELSDATTHFVALMEDPRQQINQRKKMIGNVKTKIEETKTMLATIFDFLIEAYPADSAFVQDYKVARIVVEPATIHRAEDDDAVEE